MLSKNTVAEFTVEVTEIVSGSVLTKSLLNRRQNKHNFWMFFHIFMDRMIFAKSHELVYVPISAWVSIKNRINVIIGISHFILSI